MNDARCRQLAMSAAGFQIGVSKGRGVALPLLYVRICDSYTEEENGAWSANWRWSLCG